jgi:hypothetical protein
MAGNESLNKTINEQELNKKRAELRKQTADLMRLDGASEEYIEKYLTDAAVENCLSNGFTAASLAWTLLH